MSEEQPSEVTQLLVAWREGDAGALDRLMPLVYDQLRSLATVHLSRERQGHTLQPTAVIHETYLRMVEKTHPRWRGRPHFFAVAAQLMRRILVDHARERRAAKRGGQAIRVTLAEDDAIDESPAPDVLDLDAALVRLSGFDERKAKVIELRYFGGLTVEETARVLEVSAATVRLDARLARAWLHRELAAGGLA